VNNNWYGDVTKDWYEVADDVHYRLYVRSESTKPIVICVQSFDYIDYDETRFLNDVHYDTEQEAQVELDRLHRLLFGGW